MEARVECRTLCRSGRRRHRRPGPTATLVVQVLVEAAVIDVRLELADQKYEPIGGREAGAGVRVRLLPDRHVAGVERLLQRLDSALPRRQLLFRARPVPNRGAAIGAASGDADLERACSEVLAPGPPCLGLAGEHRMAVSRVRSVPSDHGLAGFGLSALPAG